MATGEGAPGGRAGEQAVDPQPPVPAEGARDGAAVGAAVGAEEGVDHGSTLPVFGGIGWRVPVVAANRGSRRPKRSGLWHAAAETGARDSAPVEAGRRRRAGCRPRGRGRRCSAGPAGVFRSWRPAEVPDSRGSRWPKRSGLWHAAAETGARDSAPVEAGRPRRAGSRPRGRGRRCSAGPAGVFRSWRPAEVAVNRGSRWPKRSGLWHAAAETGARDSAPVEAGRRHRGGCRPRGRGCPDREGCAGVFRSWRPAEVAASGGAGQRFAAINDRAVRGVGGQRPRRVSGGGQRSGRGQWP